MESIAWTCQNPDCHLRNTNEVTKCQKCDREKRLTAEEVALKYPDKKLLLNLMETVCSLCHDQNISPGHVVQLESCGHEICHRCFNTGEKIDRCPVIIDTKKCDTLLSEFEIFSIYPAPLDHPPPVKTEYRCAYSDSCGYRVTVAPDNHMTEISCPNCKMATCIRCEVVHTGYTCEEYQTQRNIYRLMGDFIDDGKKMGEVTSPGDDGELMKFTRVLVVPNDTEFDCFLCSTLIHQGDGIQFELCKHPFCKPCIAHYIENNLTAEIYCPHEQQQQQVTVNCQRMLQLLEIKAVIRLELYEKYKQILLCSDIRSNQNLSRCFDSTCNGFKLYDDDSDISNSFRCNACNWINCLVCERIHEGLTCEQYRELGGGDDVGSNDTINMIMYMIKSGEAMACPDCKIIIVKDEGCDWVQCSQCQLEICWVTRGRRWGPAGKNDLSGGCRCGVNEKKCHPDCKYCH